MCCCCCCFPGFCTDFCSVLRFSFCTKFRRCESDQAIVFCSSVPGLKAEELHVQVEDTPKARLLQIVGQRVKREETDDGGVRSVRSSSAQFAKVYKLPREGILVDQVRAEVDQNGVITITVPKVRS